MRSSRYVLTFIACIAVVICISWYVAGARATNEVDEALAKGQKLSEAGKFTDAIRYFDKAVALDPKCSDAYEARAWAEQGCVGGARRSIEDCNRAIALNPQSIQAFDLRAINYTLIHGEKSALHDWDVAIKLDPKSAWRYGNRGNAYFELRQYTQALKDYDHMIELEPDTNAYVNRAAVYDDLGEYDKALKDSNTEIKRADCVPMLMPGKFQSTLQAVNYTNRGRAYLGLGETDKAISDLTKAISLHSPAPGEPFYFRAQAYEKLGKKDLAAQDEEKANFLAYTPKK